MKIKSLKNTKKLMMVSIAVMMLIMQGCGSKHTICPKYPAPTQGVLNKIKSLKDKDVDGWIVEQYKLNKKLKVCNE